MPYDKAKRCQSANDRLLLMQDRDDASQFWQLQEVLTLLSERVTELENALFGEEGINLQSGEASLRLKKDGSVDIRGKDLNLVGSGRINIKANLDLVIKGQKIIQN